MRTRFLSRGLCPLALLIAVAGCSSDSDMLARVGNTAITTSDFIAAARGNSAAYGPLPDSARKLLLDDLVRRELILQGAIGAGLHRDSSFLIFKDQVERQVLRDQLLRRLSGAPIAVSEAEVAEFHRWREQEVHCKVIYSYSRALARAARADLDRGVPFMQVAQRYNPPTLMPNGGDLGYVAPGSMVSPLDRYLRTASNGEVIGPIEAMGQGWFILEIGERRPRTQAPLEVQREQIASMIRQRKQRVVMVRALEHLRQEYAIQVRPGAAQDLTERYSMMFSPEVREDPTRLPPPLSEAERARTLAGFRGGVYTMGDAVTDIESGQVQGPDFNVLPTVERWIENQALERVARIEARRRQLQDEPDVRRLITARANEHLLDGYYNAQVLTVVTASEEDVRALHAQMAAGFMRLDEARVLIATLPDSAAAANLMAHAGHTGTLREAASMAAPGLRVRSERLRYPNDDPFWQQLQPVLMGLGPREYSGPYRTEKGWMVLQLVSKIQGPQDYDRLPDVVKEHLYSQAMVVKREARLAQLTDSLRRVIPVQIYPERLRRIPWPVPSDPAAPPPVARVSG